MDRERGERVIVVSKKADWSLARALALLWSGDPICREMVDPEEWRSLFVAARERRDTPALLAWRIEAEPQVGPALWEIRVQARLLCPVCFYGSRRPDLLALFQNDVEVPRAHPYWWLELTDPEILEAEEVVRRIRNTMPPEWKQLAASERNLEAAVSHIRPWCNVSDLVRFALHGFSRESRSLADLDRYQHALAGLQPFLDQPPWATDVSALSVALDDRSVDSILDIADRLLARARFGTRGAPE